MRMDLSDLSRVKILVIGDAILDVYKYGQYNKTYMNMTPAFLQSCEEYKLGGAANVALNVSKLANKTIFLSKVGFDKEGEILKGLCVEQSIKSSIQCGDTPTITKTRYYSGSQQIFRADREVSGNPIDDTVIFTLIDKFAHENCPKAVVVSDYGKGLLNETHIGDIIDCCNTYNIPVIVEAKKDNCALYKNADIVKLSEHYNKASAIEKCEVYKNAGCKNVVAAILCQGVVFDGECAGGVDFNEPQIDPSGSRDTMAATLVIGLALGFKFSDNVNIAATSYRDSSKKFGIVPIDLAEFKETVNEHYRSRKAENK